ncbi:MAG: hypothetical protein ACYDB7_12465 [Mycobacteriales bacterium]
MRHSRPRWRAASLVLLALIAAADVALCAVDALLGVRHAHQDAVATASRQALAAAVQAIVPVLSYDYLTLAQDKAAAERYLTPAWRKDYDATFSRVEQLAPQVHAQAQTTVEAAAVDQASPGQVTVLIFTNTQSMNILHPATRVDGARLLVTMVHVAGRWLIDQIVAQ